MGFNRTKFHLIWFHDYFMGIRGDDILKRKRTLRTQKYSTDSYQAIIQKIDILNVYFGERSDASFTYDPAIDTLDVTIAAGGQSPQLTKTKA